MRADLQKRLEQLKQRLVKNARIQEGDAPEEDPVEMQAELEKMARELTLLIQRINRTNAGSPFGNGTLADSLAERDVLKMRVQRLPGTGQRCLNIARPYHTL